MTGQYTYLAIILVPGLPAVLLSMWAARKALRASWPAAVLAVLVLTAYCAAIDWVAIRVLKIWSFREELVTGVRILDLYLEEWVLFLVTQSLVVLWFLLLRQTPLKQVEEKVSDYRENE